ncbi:hypothetical protein GCM10010530_38750 [Kribbella aluminosa]
MWVSAQSRKAAGPRPAIPFVARPVTDVSVVQGAYDIAITGADQLPPNQSDEESMVAAGLLQEVTCTLQQPAVERAAPARRLRDNGLRGRGEPGNQELRLPGRS